MRSGRLWSVPELSHIEPYGGGLYRYFSVEGITGVGFSVPLIDLEKNDRELKFQGVVDLLKALPEDHWIKFVTDVAPIPSIQRSGLSRSQAINEVGGVSKRLNIFFESEKSGLFLSKKTNYHNPSEAVIKQIGASPLTENETQDVFVSNACERTSKTCLDFGSEVVGVVRLKKAGVDPIDWESLANIQNEIPQPYKIICSIRALSSAKTDFWLRGKLNRDTFSRDAISQDKTQATSDALRELSLNGTMIYEWEWLLVIKRHSEEALRKDLDSVSRALRKIGEPYIETIGGVPSFCASLPGSPLHVVQKECFPTVLYYIPVFVFGESSFSNKEKTTTCLIHRLDASVHGLDIFDEKFLAYNTIITGKTGSGKSVFGNALSRALLNDRNLHLIKVDVGGSYRRECAIYGGDEVSFHLNSPSGVDPFTVVGTHLTNETLSVLTELIATLALDEGEACVSKSIRGEVERSLKLYFGGKSKDHSMAGFLDSDSSLPRLEILKRFGKGGIFENAIKSKNNQSQTSRYTYYNFESINGASNKDYSSGVMAAVIAFVNLEMIRLSKPENRAQGKRLVFFCDETKFFIEKNASFFLLTTANFRKFGHAVILTGQNIEDFFLRREGEIDRGLVLNSPTRIFFEAQTKPELLKSEFHLDERQVACLSTQAYRGSEFRQFVLQDDIGTRICRLFLTPREYWEMTSTRNDVDKLDSLKRAAPWLSENQVIEVMLIGDKSP